MSSKLVECIQLIKVFVELVAAIASNLLKTDLKQIFKTKLGHAASGKPSQQRRGLGLPFLPAIVLPEAGFR
jgi:hypothetical protein